jgi:thiamine-phosphate pyrophosphorylase
VNDRSLPRLHVVTDDAVLAGAGWLARALDVLESGGARVALHLRGPSTGPRTLFGMATELAPHVRRTGAALFLNDRVDVALVTHADGVHLGGGSLPVGEARRLLGTSPWIGVSCHRAAEAAAAASLGADYVFLGTIFETPSHPGRTGLGVAALEQAVRRAPSLPLIGIGGIGPDVAGAVVGAGAWGVAAIRGVWAAPDPGRAVSLYLEGLGE